MPKYYCVAEGCPADERKRGKYGFMASVRFFPFPSKKNPRLRKRWVDLVRRANFDPTRNDRLCSLHFEDGEPTISSPYPTLFSYNNFKEKKDRQGVVSITKRVNCVSTNETGTSSSQTDSSLDAVMMDCDGTPSAFCIPVANEVIIRTSTDKVSQIAAPVDHDYAERRQHIQTTLKNTETQTDIKGIDLDAMTTKIDDLEAKLEDKDSLLRENFVHKVTSSDAAVKRYLGLPSLMALLGLFAILDKISPALKYWRGSVGTHHQTKYQEDERKRKSGPTRKLTRFHEILLTILRLRLALPLFVLADIFGVSVTRASQIFTTWVNFMHVVFSPMIKWPKIKAC